MSYQVIARKYRPQRFEDVVGQEHVTQTLRNAIRQNRLAHAYLFAGPRGTGKTTLARILAKCLNATNGPTVDFDEADERCREIAEGRSLDVLEIDGASNRGIDEVRALRDTVKYAPAASRFKIYIIDEVHMLTKEAFNALLKTLEEPPAHVKFMFATTEPEKVLPTILSRCQRFDLRRIPVQLIVEHLRRIARQEGVDVEDAALLAIARGAEGCMRDAQSTLDQLISFCGNRIQEADVLSMFGLVAQAQLLELARAILGGETRKALELFDALARQGKDPGRLLTDLLGYFRNLLIYQVSEGDLTLLEISESEAAALQADAPRAGPEILTRIMEILADAEMRIRDTASKRILLEIALLNAIEARRVSPLDAVLQQLNELRQGRGSPPNEPEAARAARAAQAPAPSAAPAFLAERPSGSSKPPPAAAAASQTDGGHLAQLWSRLMDAVGRVSAFTRSYLLVARPVSLENNVLTVGFDPEFAEHIGLVDNPRHHALLQTKLAEFGHPGVRIRFVVNEAAPALPGANEVHGAAPPPAPALAPAAAAPAPAPAETPQTGPEPSGEALLPAEFENDPAIKAALEIFKGRIVEVRA